MSYKGYDSWPGPNKWHYLLASLILVLFWGGVGYLVYHFVAKYW
jgi:hypothetical protein